VAFTVRVKNFQSIRDAEIHIDGFGVITGANNSGKTALLRAIRGVFTNAPVGTYVRHGEAFLFVELEFEDGTNILWEKGWEKPFQKGKAINRYKINGVEISAVGRGVPPEVEALGVRQINASTERVWPQIAEQFDGTLFLINRPGSAVAEALSDVEKVGRLTEALKLSEKDRRTSESELRVREKDVETRREETKKYKGLHDVRSLVDALAKEHVDVLEAGKNLEEMRGLSVRLSETRNTNRELAGFDQTVVPPKEDSQRLLSTGSGLQEKRSLRERLVLARSASAKLDGFSPEVVPEKSDVESLASSLTTLRNLLQRLKKCTESLSTLRGFQEPSIDPSRALKLKEACRITQELRDKREQAHEATSCFSGMKNPDIPQKIPNGQLLFEIRKLREKLQEARDSLIELVGDLESTNLSETRASESVMELLGDRGICPVCSTVHEKGVHA